MASENKLFVLARAVLACAHGQKSVLVCVLRVLEPYIQHFVFVAGVPRFRACQMRLAQCTQCVVHACAMRHSASVLNDVMLKPFHDVFELHRVTWTSGCLRCVDKPAEKIKGVQLHAH